MGFARTVCKERSAYCSPGDSFAGEEGSLVWAEAEAATQNKKTTTRQHAERRIILATFIFLSSWICIFAAALFAGDTIQS
jgi:hypothetical protein